MRKPRIVTFRLDQATWDRMQEPVPYTRYKNASSFIREGIDLLLKQVARIERSEIRDAEGYGVRRESSDLSLRTWRAEPGCRHSASKRAFTPVFDGLWTRVNAL